MVSPQGVKAETEAALQRSKQQDQSRQPTSPRLSIFGPRQVTASCMSLFTRPSPTGARRCGSAAGCTQSSRGGGGSQPLHALHQLGQGSSSPPACLPTRPPPFQAQEGAAAREAARKAAEAEEAANPSTPSTNWANPAMPFGYELSAALRERQQRQQHGSSGGGTTPAPSATAAAPDAADPSPGFSFRAVSSVSTERDRVSHLSLVTQTSRCGCCPWGYGQQLWPGLQSCSMSLLHTAPLAHFYPCKSWSSWDMDFMRPRGALNTCNTHCITT